MLTRMHLIHYGSDFFDRSKFEAIEDTSWIKPLGGLWASPVESEYGWADWCKIEKWNLEGLNSSFQFFVSGEILVIDSAADIKKLHVSTCQSAPSISFLRHLEDGIDAIYLTEKGEEGTRFEGLYGWDCESVLVLNPDCISSNPNPRRKP